MSENPNEIDFASYRPLFLSIIFVVLLWVAYILVAPDWALWTLAILFGITGSVAAGYEIRRAVILRIERKDHEARQEIQDQIDNVGHIEAKNHAGKSG